MKISNIIKAVLFAFVAAPTATGEYSSDYTPTFQDLKPIFELGHALNNLAGNVTDGYDTAWAIQVLTVYNIDRMAFRMLGQAYCDKIGMDADSTQSMMGHMESATDSVSECYGLLTAPADLGYTESEANAACVDKIRQAQAYIGKFLEGSGIKDSRFKQYCDQYGM